MKKYLFFTLLMAVTSASVQSIKTDDITAEFTYDKTTYKLTDTGVGALTINPDPNDLDIPDANKVWQAAYDAWTKAREERKKLKDSQRTISPRVTEEKKLNNSPQYSLLQSLYTYFSNFLPQVKGSADQQSKETTYDQNSYLQRVGLYLKKKTQDAYNYYWQNSRTK